LKKKLLFVNKVEVKICFLFITFLLFSNIIYNKILKGERNELEEKGYLKEYNDIKMTYEAKYQEYYEQVKIFVLYYNKNLRY